MDSLFWNFVSIFFFVDIKSKIPPPSGQQVGEKKKPSFTSILVPFPKLACNVNALYDRLVLLLWNSESGLSGVAILILVTVDLKFPCWQPQCWWSLVSRSNRDCLWIWKCWSGNWARWKDNHFWWQGFCVDPYLFHNENWNIQMRRGCKSLKLRTKKETWKRPIIFTSEARKL